MKRLGPRTDRRDFLGLQFRFRMQQAIGKRRHALPLDLLADLSQVVVCLFRVFLSFPILKIQMPATLVNIIGDDPRVWGDSAVPRPASLVRMTVTATAHQRRIDIWGSATWEGSDRDG